MSKYKIIGLAVGAAGYLLGLVADMVAERQLDELVEEKVNEALATQKEEA